MDSPRGRIDLYRAVMDGRITLGPDVVQHFDRCLGCMGCMTACPSGVRYDVIVEDARARIEHAHPRSLPDRLHRSAVFALFPHPLRLRIAAFLLFLWRWTGLQWVARRTGILRLLSRRVAQLDALAPPVDAHMLAARLPRRTLADGERRLRVGLVAGCVQRVFFPGVNEATLRVLAAEGCEVVVPRRQGCCGALSIHAGRDAEALAMARALIARFEDEHIDVVAVNAAGCGSHLKDAGLDLPVRDVSELLAELGSRAERRLLELRVAFQDSCHLAHAQGIRQEPREVLRAIPGLELVEPAEQAICCGSAGIYNLLQTAAAREMGERKAAHVLAAAPDVYASANPGCLIQVAAALRRAGKPLPALHPIELVDASIRGVGAPDLVAAARR
jgi:glycolate oxidase iron-sulfur subunit